MSYNDQLIEHVVETYCAETGNTEFIKDEVCAWAIDNGHWKPSKKSQIELLRDELSAAMRGERKKINGKKIRQYHCIRRKLSDGYVQTVWANIDVATDPFMEQSLALRRKGIAGIVYQYHCDTAYWKEKNPDSNVQAHCDFGDDNADRDHAIVNGHEVDDGQSEFDGLNVDETV